MIKKMFKKIKFLVIILLGFALMGCSPKTEDKLDAWVDSVLPLEITENIVLPETHPDLGGMVIWNTDKVSFNFEGRYTKPTVTEIATITVQVILNGKTYNITKTVSVKGEMPTIDFIANWFAEKKVKINRISSDITLDTFPNTHPVFGGSITWTSANEEVLANDGTYKRPEADTKVTINYTVVYKDETKDYTAEALVLGVPATVKFNEAKEWILTQLPSGELTEDSVLPTDFGLYGMSITWTAFGSSIVTSEGQIKRPLYDTKASLTATLTLPNLVKMTATYDFIIEGENKVFENKWQAVDLFLEKIQKEAVSNLKYYTYGFEPGYEKMENTCFGYIPFYTAPMYTLYEDILRVSPKVRSGQIKPSTEYVTVHDTATATGDELHHNTYLKNLTEDNSRTVSWHYTCGPNRIYHHVPDNEVAYHAGDGSGVFSVTDSGIAATTKIPTLGISLDGYWTFNGAKSSLKAPTNGDVILHSSRILPGGIYTEVGTNGNYYIGNTYFNESFGGNICNYGGNRNSIGIESTMKAGDDYTKTMRNLAKLVARLLNDNGLGLDRIKQHWHFSGKDCPRTIRASGRWQEFIEITGIELFALQHLQDVSFVWTSQSPTILDNFGKIITHPGEGTVVSYSVEVTIGTESRSFDFTSVLTKPATTFTDLDYIIPA